MVKTAEEGYGVSLSCPQVLWERIIGRGALYDVTIGLKKETATRAATQKQLS